MDKEFAKIYEPQKYEDEIYKHWEQSGFFNPDVCVNKGICQPDAEPFSIVLPPPNITAKLHLGHSSMLAIEDLMIRYHRMKGHKTLWVPGTDHAAIATQNAVEKKIFIEEGLTRHDLGREKLLERIWKFLRETQSTILRQTRKMGASLDWSREAFTLDDTRVKAVRKMFLDMYNEGVIYRGERIVNWCPRCLSTLADDEVEHEAQKAKLYTFKYSADFPFSIATTRLETKLGDTAVAVNPKDKRYKKYIGREFAVDFCKVKLKLKVIADWHVDMNFGTGALGVTPAHSMADWQMAEDNDLEIIKVIDEKGNIRDGFGEFSNLPSVKAREIIVEKLKQTGLLEKEEEIDNNLSVCYRCDTAIEPLPSKQWFVSVDKKIKRLGGKSLKQKSIEVAQKNQIKFLPDRFKKRYLDWMENLRDWCISRQIWFGHRIPVWYKENSDEIYVGDKAPAGDDWKQDEDSLDTWFSSGMWTFSTLGWPDTFQNDRKTGDLATYHPTQVLETGYEIITLWVSRMIMMTLFAIGEIPFKNVYLHGMVLDKNGKKMSKSKGNGIDPIEMIDKFGADAVRLSLLIGNTPGNDLRLFEEKISGFRNFSNKLWNIARFMSMNIDEPRLIGNDDNSLKPKTDTDKAILRRLNDLIASTSDNLEKFNFSSAGEDLRAFTWNELADWYLEKAKIEGGKSEILNYILNTVLKLWHPFVPFVTETIWQQIYGRQNMLMVQKWPKNFLKKNEYTKECQQVKLVDEVITNIRVARADNGLEPAKKINVLISAGDKAELLSRHSDVICRLGTNIEKLEVKNQASNPGGWQPVACGSGIEMFLDLSGAIDKDKIKKELEQTEKYLVGLRKKLENKEFVQNAPQAVVDKEKQKLQEAEERAQKLKGQLK